MLRQWKGLVLLGWFLALGVAVMAQGFGYMDQIPAAQGFVNDQVGVLDATQERRLEEYLTQFAQQSSNEIAIAIMDLPEDASLEEFTNDVARKWGVGGEDLNNGVLVAIYPNQRKIRIEVGYGLEPVITDALSGRIIREQMQPALRQGDYYTAVVQAVRTLSDAAQGEYNEQNGRQYRTPARRPARTSREDGGGGRLVILVMIIVIFLVLARRGGGGGGGYGGGGWNWFPLFWIFGSGWSGGGGSSWGSGSSWGGGDSGGWGGGGFGGFGGGDFGGGGASGDW